LVEVAVASPILTFGSWDGEPFVLAKGPGWIKAWSVRDGSDSWTRVDDAAVSMEGRVLSRAAFDAKFPSLPPLPSSDFQAGSAPANASA
jgi:hypothetical protein